MTIVAKPVIDKKFWILQKNDQKIGNIEATNNGYQVTINNQVEQYRTIRMAAQRANIQFEAGVKISKPDTHNVHGYPAASRVHNPVWDVQQQLPLYIYCNTINQLIPWLIFQKKNILKKTVYKKFISLIGLIIMMVMELILLIF